MGLIIGDEGYGETSVVAVKLGSETVNKIYCGSNLVLNTGGASGGDGGIESGGSWSQLGSDIDGDLNADLFGYSVALSKNGLTFAAGAPGSISGHVKVFQYSSSSGSWSQLGSTIYGQTAGDEAGTAVALSDDGLTVAIASMNSDDGGSNVGHVRVFRYSSSSGSWSQLGSNIPGEAVDDYSGDRIALNYTGEIVAIGATLNDGGGSNTGHVRVFQYSSSSDSWSQLGSDIDGGSSGDRFGLSVSLSENGLRVAIGAERADPNGANDAGQVKIFEYSSGSWSQVGNDINGSAGDLSGASSFLSRGGGTVAIGAPSNDDGGLTAGAVRVYGYSSSSSGNWQQLGDDILGENSGDNFGKSVAISSSGSIVAAGAIFNDDGGTESSHVRVFQYSSGSWSQLGGNIVGEASYDRAYKVHISGDGTIVAIGASLNDGTADRAGHVRVYQYSSSGGDDGGGGGDGGDGGSAPTYFTPAAGLTSSGTGSASVPMIFSSDLAATNPIVTVGNAESGGYVLIEATVNSGSDGDDDQQLSLMKNSTSVGNFFDTDSWGGSYKFTLAPSEDDTLGLARSASNISTSSVEFRARAGTSVNFSVTRESDDTTNSGQRYVEFSFDAGDFPLDLWGIKVSISGNRVLYGSTTAFSGAVIYQERFTTQPSSLIYNYNRTSATGNTNSSIGDVLDLKRFIVNGEPILRLFSYNGYQLSNLTILVEPVTHLRETITNYQTGTITGAAIAENDD